MLLKYIFVCFLSRVQLVHLCKLEMMRGKEGLWITERGLYITEVKNKMLSFQPEGRKIAYTYFQNNTLKKKNQPVFPLPLLSPFFIFFSSAFKEKVHETYKCHSSTMTYFSFCSSTYPCSLQLLEELLLVVFVQVNWTSCLSDHPGFQTPKCSIVK